MKRIINGKRFDTAAPGTMQVATYSDGSTRDFRHVREAIYRTIRGTWFLAGCGGPMSAYAEYNPSDRSSSGGTADQAREWLENHNETEALEHWFGKEIEDA